MALACAFVLCWPRGARVRLAARRAPCPLARARTSYYQLQFSGPCTGTDVPTALHSGQHGRLWALACVESLDCILRDQSPQP